MKLLHLFVFWFDPKLWFKKRFWKYDYITPAGYKIKCRWGVGMIFDK